MNACEQCGADVSAQYWQVFSVDGTLHGCLHCDGRSGDHGPADIRER